MKKQDFQMKQWTQGWVYALENKRTKRLKERERKISNPHQVCVSFIRRNTKTAKVNNSSFIRRSTKSAKVNKSQGQKPKKKLKGNRREKNKSKITVYQKKEKKTHTHLIPNTIMYYSFLEHTKRCVISLEDGLLRWLVRYWVQQCVAFRSVKHGS